MRCKLTYLWQMSHHRPRLPTLDIWTGFILYIIFAILSSLYVKAAHWHTELKMGRSPMKDSLHRQLTEQKRTPTSGRLEGVWTTMRAHVRGALISVLEKLPQLVIGSRCLRWDVLAYKIISTAQGSHNLYCLTWHIVWSTPDLGQDGQFKRTILSTLW